MTFEEFWEKEIQKRYPIGDTRWALHELKELAKCAWDAAQTNIQLPQKIEDMAKKFEDNHEGTTLRYAWACGYHTALNNKPS